MLRSYQVIAAVAAFITSIPVVSPAQEQRPIALTPTESAQTVNVELANAAGQQVNLEVMTACVNDTATFKIVNVGDAWPRMGTLSLYRVTSDQVKKLSDRKMRFAQGQKASFRLKKVGTDTMAIFVQPSWYERPFKFDAQVACN